MKISIPFLTDGKKGKKILNRPVNTTSDFGFCQPIDTLLLEPESTVNYQIGQGVRLAPMPCPTFGEVQLKTYINYVKLEDIYHAFPSMMDQQSYFGRNNSYIPLEVPSVAPAYLLYYIRMFGRFSVWKFSAAPTRSNTLLEGTIGSSPVSTLATIDAICSQVGTRWDTNCGISNYFSNFFSRKVTLLPGNNNSNAIKPSGADWCEYVIYNSEYYLVCGRFGQYSKNLMKVFLGCGFELNESVVPVSVMPLFAYYKTWFDLFNPARDKTWKDTFAFSFMEYVEQENKSSWSSWSSDITAQGRFDTFLSSLAYCYYTDNPDFVSVHIDQQTNSIAGAESLTYLDSQNQSQYISAAAGENVSDLSGVFGGNTIKLLLALTRRMNIKSAAGGRIAESLKSILGSNYSEEKSSFIGSQIVKCQIDDVYATADTTGAFLGEFAGKSVGGSQGEVFKFSNDFKDSTGYGILVVISCAVPASCNYVQGMDMQLRAVTRNQFYHRDVDGLTLLPTEKKYIFSAQENSTALVTPDFDAGFGNAPIYIETKTRTGRVNGDMRMQSTRSSFLPYTLDKVLPYDYVALDSSNKVTIRNLDPSLIVNGSKWRYIGRFPWIGTLDRIFVNSGSADVAKTIDLGVDLYAFHTDRLDDNFIVHNLIKCSKLSPSLPLSDSWNTEPYGESMSIEAS